MFRYSRTYRGNDSPYRIGVENRSAKREEADRNTPKQSEMFLPEANFFQDQHPEYPKQIYVKIIVLLRYATILFTLIIGLCI